MPQWLLYVFVVSALLSIAGWLTEQALRQRRVPTRWAWVVTMILIVLLAYLSLPGVTTGRTTHGATLQTSWAKMQHVAPVTLPPLMPPSRTPTALAAATQWNAVIVKLWLSLSATTMLGVAVSGAYVFWRRRTWPMRLMGAHCVGITADIGPAVVGLLRPTIAIPTWVLDRSEGQQQLILAHEASHLQARDPLLLTGSLVVLILMPWNALLWWQWHRLRHAIEVDCDARILRAGHDTQAYGEALIDVGQQRSRFVGAVAAMSETRTLLERRIEIMASRARKHSVYAFAALCVVATLATAAATQIATPDTPTARQEVTVDPATLDRYVGKYQVHSYIILTITRDGSQLYAQITGQPKLPEYAEAPNKFFLKVIDAQLTFAVGDSGPAISATMHQNGRDIVAQRIDDATAQALEQQLTDRVSRQQPQSGSEAALRKSIAAIGAGAPNYGDMDPALQDATRKQLPVLENFNKDYGSVKTVEFRGVSDNGADKYLVTHESGNSQSGT
jgi:bla regulator protein blaR1